MAGVPARFFLLEGSDFKIINMSYIKENLVSSLRGNCPLQKYSVLLLLLSEQPAEMWGVVILFLVILDAPCE